MCPKCGSDKVQIVQNKNNDGVGFNNKAGTCGCCLLGPIGLLFGLLGSGKSKTTTFRMCVNCGHKFK
jgi:DNA-directed RNA polymerase subunit M/transcription elongation factor TFIIS